MLSAEFLEAAKTIVILTTFWAIIVLDIWAIGHWLLWLMSVFRYGGIFFFLQYPRGYG